MIIATALILIHVCNIVICTFLILRMSFLRLKLLEDTESSTWEASKKMKFSHNFLLFLLSSLKAVAHFTFMSPLSSKSILNINLVCRMSISTYILQNQPVNKF